jgi:antitoxin FitA
MVSKWLYFGTKINGMATITIKNLPDTLYKKLKNRAKTNHRSINGEIVNLISKELGGSHFDPIKVIESARISQSWAKGTLSDLEIQESKEEGRA